MRDNRKDNNEGCRSTAPVEKSGTAFELNSKSSSYQWSVHYHHRHNNTLCRVVAVSRSSSDCDPWTVWNKNTGRCRWWPLRRPTSLSLVSFVLIWIRQSLCNECGRTAKQSAGIIKINNNNSFVRLFLFRTFFFIFFCPLIFLLCVFPFFYFSCLPTRCIHLHLRSHQGHWCKTNALTVCIWQCVYKLFDARRSVQWDTKARDWWYIQRIRKHSLCLRTNWNGKGMYP